MTAAEAPASRRLAAIGFATLGRTAFGAALSVVVLLRLPSGEAVEVFQLLVLQAVFSSALSGSAFVRGLADGAREDAAAAGLRGLVLAWAALVAVIALVDAALIPREFRAEHVTADGWKLALLALGTIGVAGQTALQGMVVGQIGPMRTFLPTGAAFLAMSVLCVVLRIESAGAALVLLVAAQLLPLAALLAAAPEARSLVRRAASASLPPGSGQMRETLVYGAINGGALLMVFAIRAWWEDGVAPELAERVFFVLRLSDVWLQVAFYAVAMSGRLQRAELFRPAPLPCLAAMRALGAAGAGLGAVALAAIALAPPGAAMPGWQGVALLIGLQLMVDALRLPASAILVAATRARLTGRLAALSLLPILAAGAATLPLARALPEAAMFLYYAGAGALVVPLWVWQRGVTRPDLPGGRQGPTRRGPRR